MMKKSLITMLLGLTIILSGATILFHYEYKRCQKMWFEQVQQCDSLKRETGQKLVVCYSLIQRMQTYNSILDITLSNYKIPLTHFKSICDMHTDWGPSIWIDFVDYKNKADRQTQDFISRLKSGQSNAEILRIESIPN